MDNCIFAPFCTLPICDKACPSLVETSYLFERNGCSLKGNVPGSSAKDILKVQRILHADNKLKITIADDTSTLANLLTYCGICENWQGNRLHCNVYHLKYSAYLDSVQRSWGLKDIPESLEYTQIWINTAKILIISNLDFVKFQDFQSQTLLNIIHDRMSNGLTTIVVSPKLSTLVGSGMFFNRIKAMFEEAVITV